jgi:membrane-associated phospholipid phosphatase
MADLRYCRGVASYLELLDTERERLSAEQGLAQAQRDELISVVQLYRALGGGWEQQLTASPDCGKSIFDTDSGGAAPYGRVLHARRMVPLRRCYVWVAVAILAAGSPAPGQGRESEFAHQAADPGHDLTGKEFLKDLAVNFTGLIDKRNIPIVLAGGAGYGLATIPEQDLEAHFARADMWGAWGNPGKYIGNPPILAGHSGTMFAASRKTDNLGYRSLSYSLVHRAIMSSAVVRSAKAAARWLRPSQEDKLAFPSGHATDSFMFATVVADQYGWKATVPSYLIAAYVSATRLGERKHHLTDVAAGAAIGYLIGHKVTRRMRVGQPSRVGFNIVPSRRGFTASAQLVDPKPLRHATWQTGPASRIQTQGWTVLPHAPPWNVNPARPARAQSKTPPAGGTP